MLLIQRVPDKHDEGEPQARWELPGGTLDGGDGTSDPTVWAGALREWSEETGATLPPGATPVGGWADGGYEGFVVHVAREADLGLDPEPEEASAARWWAPEELADERVRDKLTEQLDLLRPLLKSEWEDFHERTDDIVDRYTPAIRDAMANVLHADAVRGAMRAAWTAEKSRSAPGSRNKPAHAHHLNALGSRVVQILRSAKQSLQALRAALLGLYHEAAAEGAREAATAAGGTVPADIGLSRVLSEVDVTVRGVVDTEIDRIGRVIEEAMQHPVDIAKLEAEVAAVLNDGSRARLIAETELARARTIAMRATYRANNVPEVRWLHQPGACERCLENAAVSPIPVDASWPNGDVPVHPLCRCVEAPVVKVPVLR